MAEVQPFVGSYVDSKVAPSVKIDDEEQAAKVRARQAHVARFKPDSVLELTEVRETTNRSIASALFTLTLYETAGGAPVWKAAVALRLTGLLTGLREENPAGELSQAIVTRLSEDGILKSCPPPVKPS